jgi:serine/threonine protein kinase
VLSCSESNHDILTEGRVGSCEIIPNYRLESRQEATPFTETYLAAHTILNKPYLFKTFAPAPPDENAKKQFLSEAQALATMIHPNVARVFESGTLADGALYVVTRICGTFRPNNARRKTRTRRRTFTRSASCSTKCSPGECRSTRLTPTRSPPNRSRKRRPK